MLKINCKIKRLKEALKLGKKLNVSETVSSCIRNLMEKRNDPKQIIYIADDWAPHSFQFAVRNAENGNLIYCGGIICHNLPNGPDPMAVIVSENREIFWSTHT